MQMNLSFFFKGQFFPYFSSGAFASVLKKVPRVQDRGVSFTFGPDVARSSAITMYQDDGSSSELRWF